VIVETARGEMQYRCEAVTLEGFVQQLAVCYVGRGYWHYVTGQIPAGKDPRAIDAKLISRYGIDVTKWTRARRKQQGRASMQYLRFGDFFVLLATDGVHRFFAEESAIRDARTSPVVFGGYSIGIRGRRVHVRIADRAYAELRAYLLEIALHRSVPSLANEFYSLPFEPWGPVKVQHFSLLGAVNDLRRRAGLRPVPKQAVWLKRQYVRPFGPAVHEPSTRF
jgi:hypothetical protein